MGKQDEAILSEIVALNKLGYSVEFRPVPDGLLKCSIRQYGEVDVKEAHGLAATHEESLLNAQAAHEEALAEASGRKVKKK